MEKKFVSYNEALELKELGFDEPCFGWFTFGYLRIGSIVENKHVQGDGELLAPIFSQAFGFFREKYDLQYWFHDGGYLGKVFVKITGYKRDKFYFSSSEPMDYEEAELACLQKLIQIVKDEKHTRSNN